MFYQGKEPEYTKVRRKSNCLRDPHSGLSESQGKIYLSKIKTNICSPLKAKCHQYRTHLSIFFSTQYSNNYKLDNYSLNLMDFVKIQNHYHFIYHSSYTKTTYTKQLNTSQPNETFKTKSKLHTTLI